MTRKPANTYTRDGITVPASTVRVRHRWRARKGYGPWVRFEADNHVDSAELGMRLERERAAGKWSKVENVECQVEIVEAV